MGVLIQCENNTVKAFLDGEIDHHTAQKIRQEIDNIIVGRENILLILDFEKVSFMDSSAIGLIMGRYRLLQSQKGKMEVVNLSDRNYKMMLLAGMQTLCKLRKREEK